MTRGRTALRSSSTGRAPALERAAATGRRAASAHCLPAERGRARRARSPCSPTSRPRTRRNLRMAPLRDHRAVASIGYETGSGSTAGSKGRCRARTRRSLRTRSRQDPANYAPLTPLGFIERAAYVYPNRTAVIHGARRARGTRPMRVAGASRPRLRAADRRRRHGCGDARQYP